MVIVAEYQQDRSMALGREEITDSIMPMAHWFLLCSHSLTEASVWVDLWLSLSTINCNRKRRRASENFLGPRMSRHEKRCLFFPLIPQTWYCNGVFVTLPNMPSYINWYWYVNFDWDSMWMQCSTTSLERALGFHNRKRCYILCQYSRVLRGFLRALFILNNAHKRNF